MSALVRIVVVAVAGLSAGCAAMGGQHLAPTPESAQARVEVLARSRLWTPTRIRALDLKTGPRAADAILPKADVTCTYLDQGLGGRSPKFLCKLSEQDVVKVKFGVDNGEVFGEVLATRLLWALGFGADRMYPAAVVCRGCPAALGGTPLPGDARRFDPAVIERQMPGREWPPDGPKGWAWNDLNVVNPRMGGATLAQRDALKLLAVFLQHTDSKPEQQRILCLAQPRDKASAACARPFLMISDVGLTFGRASRMNANEASGANLAAWRQTPIWKDGPGCRGNLPRSLTGTLEDPAIGEQGRRFLADLLGQISDRQLRDLFEAARVDRRLRSPGDASSGYATVDEWVDVFKEKRAQIASRRCD